jgi:hypothetical protein
MASTGFACRKRNMNLQTGAERIGCVDAIPSKDLTAPVKVHPRTMQNGRAPQCAPCRRLPPYADTFSKPNLCHDTQSGKSCFTEGQKEIWAI